MLERFTHVFEAGRRGKPDELDWQIAQLMAARCLEIDPYARCNLRVEGGWDREGQKPSVIVRGEISEPLLSRGTLEQELCAIAAGHYNRVNRTSLSESDFSFSFASLNPQAAALASNARHENSGDSGSGLGIAVRGTHLALPYERFLAKEIANLVDEIYRADGAVPDRLANSDVARIEGLRSDGKVEVVATYLGRDLHSVRGVTIAANHEAALPVGELRGRLEPVVREYLSQFEQAHPGVIVGAPRIHINGAGDWTDVGGWRTDAGNSDAKPHREWFGTWGVNEDSGSGEDPSKPSATGTLLARYIAVQVVGSGLADMARALLKFDIGEKYASFLEVNTYGTGRASQDDIERRVHEWIAGGQLPHSLSDATREFGLRDPCTYRRLAAASDYFHLPHADAPWNRVVVEPVIR